MRINDGAAGLGDAAGVFTEIGGPTMATPIRVTMLVAGLLVFGALPAVAQQAAPGASINPPATAAPEAAQALPDATAELGTAIQELQREVYALGKAARERAAALAGGGPPIVLTTDQLIAIAGGALVGAIVADIVLDGGLMTMMGVLAGGVVGHWLYTQPPLPAADKI